MGLQGPGSAPQVDTAGIAARIQQAYAASKAAGTPLSDADLEAYARRESGGTLGLQELADYHVAKTAAQPMGLAPLAGHEFLAGAAQWPATTVGTPAVAGRLATGLTQATQPTPGGSTLGNIARMAGGRTLDQIVPGGQSFVHLLGATGTGLGNALAPITEALRNFGEGIAPAPTPEEVGPGVLRHGLAATANIAGNATVGGLVGMGVGAVGRTIYNQTPFGRILKALGEGGTTAASAENQVLQAGGRGEIKTLADLDPALTNALKEAASDNPKVANRAATFFEARAQGAPDRLASDVAEAAKTLHPDFQRLMAKMAADNPGATAEQITKAANEGQGILYGATRGVGEANRSGLIKQAVEAWKDKGSNELTDLMQGLAPEDAQAVRSAVTRKFVDELEGGQIPEKTTAFVNKLQAIFPDKATFEDLLGQVEAERHLARTAGLFKPPANPPTELSKQAIGHLAKQIAGRTGQLGLAAKALLSLGHPAAFAGYLGTAVAPEIARAANRGIASHVGSMLLSQGPEMEALLAHLARAMPPTAWGAGVQGALGAGTSAALQANQP